MRTLICLAVCLVLARGARAQEKPAGEERAATWDALSKAVVTTFENDLVYRLGTEGVKNAACKTSFVLTSPAGETKCSSVFTWDGKTSTLAWDNALLGGQLAQQGFGKPTYDAQFKSGLLDALKDASLVATPSEGTVSIAVSGGKSGFKTLTYKDGVLSSVVVAVPMMGKKVDITVTNTYQKAGKKLVLTGWTVAFDMPGGGPFKEITNFTFKDQGGFLVWATGTSISPFGTRAITFAWTLNKPAPQPAAKPAPK